MGHKRPITYAELERTGEVATTYFNALFHQFAGKTDLTLKNPVRILSFL
jgi:hypothetical protein